MSTMLRALLSTLAGSALVASSGCSSGLPRAFPASGSSRVAAATVAAQSLTFSAWCTSWGLKCEPTPSPLPAGTKPLTAAQWQSLLSVVKTVGNTTTNLDLGTADLDSPTLAKAADALGETALWQAFHARLQDAKVKNLHIGGGSVVLTSDAGSSHTSPISGLIVVNGPEVKLSVTEDNKVAVSGLTVSGAHGETADLSSIELQDDNKLNWSGAAASVSAVPAAFLAQELIGLPQAKSPKITPSAGYAAVQPLVAPFGDLLARDSTSIDIGQAQIDALAAKLPDLLGDSKYGDAVKAVVAKLNSIQSTAGSRQQGLLLVNSSDQITCNIGTQGQLQLAAQFGLSSITRVDDSTTAMQFTGLKVATGGVINIPVDISEIDLKPTSIVLRNLPIIGDITIDLSKDPPAGGSTPGGAAPEISCF